MRRIHLDLNASTPVDPRVADSMRVGIGAVRFSLGRTSTEDEIAEVTERISTVLPRL